MHNSLSAKLQDYSTMTVRCLKHITRNFDNIGNTLVMPTLMLLLFYYVFGGAFEAVADSYLNYVVPGVLILTIGTCSAVTAVSVANDITQGIVDRFRSMPIASTSFVVGHIIASLLRNLIATTIMTGVAFLIGFRTSASIGQWSAIVGLVVLFTLACTCLSVVFGLLANSAEGANTWTLVLNLLPYTSSAFITTETMPRWLQVFANNQPFTVLTDAIRSLFYGTWINAWPSIFWCLGISVISLTIAIFLFKRKTSQ